MKLKIGVVLTAILCCLVGIQINRSYAAADSAATQQTTVDSTTNTTSTEEAEASEETSAQAPVEEEKPGFIQVIKAKIIDGGVAFMGVVLICLILGLTVAIEKVILLNLSSTNVTQLLNTFKDALQNGGIENVKETAALEKGPVASIVAQSLIRTDEGIAGVEKSIESYGSAEVTKLEKGMSWISLFISLAPMFGFMGTVIGMIDAFGTIKQSADIKIGEVAGGIETALLTTAAGLVVAVILQTFYNYCQSKIEDITTQLEDGANGFINLLISSKKLS